MSSDFTNPHNPENWPDYSDEELHHMTRQDILKQIDTERDYQDKKWGHEADDTRNYPNDWTAFIANYSSKWFPGGFTPYSAETVAAFRKAMIKTAALAVAAIESVDRQTQADGKPFYQSDAA